MPVIPTYKPSVETRAAPGGTLRAQPQIGAAGNNLSHAIDDAAVAAEKVMIEREVTYAKEVEQQFRTEALDILHGENGYYSSRGGDTVRAQPQAEKALGELRQKYLSQVDSPRARRMLDDALGGYVLSEREQMRRYLTTQETAWHDSVSKSRVETAINEAAASWSNPHRMAESDAIVENEVRGQIERAGLGGDPEVAQQKIAEARSAVRSAALQSALREDAWSAVRLYDQMRGDLTPDDAAKIETRMDDARARVEADRIFKTGGGLREIDAIKDVGVRDRVMTHFSQLRAAQESSERRAREAISDAALVAVRRGQITDSSQLPIGLSAASYKSLDSLIRRQAENRPVKTDVRTWYGISELSRTQPDQFQRVDLTEYADRLSLSDLQQFQNERIRLEREQKREAGQFQGTKTSIESPAAEADLYAKRAGIGKDLLPEFVHGAQQQIRAMEENEKRSLTPAERQKIFDTLLKQVVIDEGVVYDNKALAAEVASGAKEIEDVPTVDAVRIRTSLGAIGIAGASDAQVRAAYRSEIVTGSLIDDLIAAGRARRRPDGSALTEQEISAGVLTYLRESTQ